MEWEDNKLAHPLKTKRKDPKTTPKLGELHTNQSEITGKSQASWSYKPETGAHTRKTHSGIDIRNKNPNYLKTH